MKKPSMRKDWRQWSRMSDTKTVQSQTQSLEKFKRRLCRFIAERHSNDHSIQDFEDSNFQRFIPRLRRV